jgi:hypothetical protein
MNSTATELEFTRRSAMRAIVKGFVFWTLGLAVLFGSPAVSLAEPPAAPRPQVALTQPPARMEGVVIQGNQIKALPGYVLQRGPNNSVTAMRSGGGSGAGETTLSCDCTAAGTCTVHTTGGFASCAKRAGDTCSGSCDFYTISTGVGGSRSPYRSLY